MNADRVPTNVAKRYSHHKFGKGTVIINLQQTHLDESASVRVWAKLDDAFRLLAEIMGLGPIEPPAVTCPEGDVYDVPYDSTGSHDESMRLRLNLREDSVLTIANRGAINYGKVGKVTGKTPDGDYLIAFNNLRPFVLGRWWINTALAGGVDVLPVINQPAVCWKHGIDRAPEMPPPPRPIEGPLRIVQSHTVAADGVTHQWHISIGENAAHVVRQAIWKMPPWVGGQDQVKQTEPPFGVKLSTKGTAKFVVKVELLLKTPFMGFTMEASHQINYEGGEGAASVATEVPWSEATKPEEFLL